MSDVATLDVKAMREALIDAAAEKRGIAIGLCLAAAILVRDFDYPTLALEILGADGIDRAMIDALDLEPCDSEPLLKIVKE
jgi:hypothetical protein